MKTRLLIAFLVMLFSAICCPAQDYVQKYGFVSPMIAGPGSGVSFANTGVTSFAIFWYPQVTLTSCAVQVDSSSDGVTWGNGDLIASQNCSTTGSTTAASLSSGKIFVRVNVTALTGNGGVNVTLKGWGGAGSGGAVTGVTASSPVTSSGGAAPNIACPTCPTQAASNTSGDVITAAGGQAIQDSGTPLSALQTTANVGPGCQTGCSYPVGVGYYTPIPFGSVTTLMTANNTPQFIKFYNQSLQKLGNATIRVVTASAGGHASIAVYSIGATTITQIWTTGQQSTASGNTNIPVTPASVNLLANTNYYIGWCADNTTATLAGVTNGGQAGSMGATGAANSYGVDATDTCTNGTMPSSATIANIANNVNASIAGIWATN
jgi:hypothetical protein